MEISKMDQNDLGTLKSDSEGKSKKTSRKLKSVIRVKQAPQRPPTLATDIYITRKTGFNSLLKRCERLLLDPNNAQDRRKSKIKSKSDTQPIDFNKPTLSIHGLGSAIKKSIELANALKRRYPDVAYTKITTDTIPLVDTVERMDPFETKDGSSTEKVDFDLDSDSWVESRFNSAIHIHFYRIQQSKNE